jgi:hypothetical protein
MKRKLEKMWREEEKSRKSGVVSEIRKTEEGVKIYT